MQSTAAKSPQQNTRPPLGIRLVAGMFFLLALWNVVRAVILAQEYAFLAAQGLGSNVLVRLFLALGFAAGFLVLAVGLWRRWPRTRPGAMLLLSGYALYNLALLFLVVQSPVEKQAWPARLLGYIIALALTGWLLYRPGSRDKPVSSAANHGK